MIWLTFRSEYMNNFKFSLIKIEVVRVCNVHGKAVLKPKVRSLLRLLVLMEKLKCISCSFILKKLGSKFILFRFFFTYLLLSFGEKFRLGVYFCFHFLLFSFCVILCPKNLKLLEICLFSFFWEEAYFLSV